MVSIQTTLTKFILATILLISLLSFIVFIQLPNKTNDRLTENKIFNGTFNQLNSQIINSSNEAQSKYNSFNSEEPQPSLFSIVLFGIVSVGKSFSSITFGFFGAIIKLPMVVLGIPEALYSLIITLLVIIVIIGVWLLYKIGG